MAHIFKINTNIWIYDQVKEDEMGEPCSTNGGEQERL
jgi:hypothetical protein